MSIKNAERPERNPVRSTVDTALLSALLNRELGAEAKVFNVKVEFTPHSSIWQAWVEHFKGTHTRINPELLIRHERMQELTKELATKLLASMQPKQKAELKETTLTKAAGEKK